MYSSWYPVLHCLGINIDWLTFPNGGYDLQTKWELTVVLYFAFQIYHPGLQNVALICIHISTWCTYFILHFQMVSTRCKQNGEFNSGATFRFPDTSSRFAECCTNLDPHSDMVHFFSSYICKWGLLHVQSGHMIKWGNRETWGAHFCGQHLWGGQNGGTTPKFFQNFWWNLFLTDILYEKSQ